MNGTKNKRLAKNSKAPKQKPQPQFCHKNSGLSRFSTFFLQRIYHKNCLKKL